MKLKLEEELDWNENTSSYISDLIKSVKECNQIVIFGAGIGGKITYSILSDHGIADKVVCFSDNNSSKIGTIYEGIPVIKPQQLALLYTNILVIVSSTAMIML